MTTDPSQSKTLIDKIAANRQPVGYAALALGVVMAILTITWAMRWNDLRIQPPPKAPEPQSQEAPKPEEPAPPSLSDGADYLPPAIWAGLLTGLFLGAGAWQLSRLVEPGRERATTRICVIIVVGTAGLLTALLGFALAWRWQQSILDWINKGDLKEARWVLAALAVFLGGLFILFLGVQPARAVEREDVVMRRVLYGSNTVLTGLLLLVMLIVINVVVSVKLPEKVVTTTSGFKGLSSASLEFLRSMPEEANIYLIMPESFRLETGRTEDYTSLYIDCRELLDAVAEVTPKVKVKFLSPVTEMEAIREVHARLKVNERDRNQYGILIGYGANEELTEFIPSNQLVSITEEGGLVFQGENRLMTELSFLSGGGKRPIVYFTQSNDELAIESNPASPRLRTALLLVEDLKSRKYDVRPLRFEPGVKPNLSDATMVIVAAPRTAFEPDRVEILREYLRPRGKDSVPGKLIVVLPAFRGADGKVPATGLEPLLEGYGVQLENKRVFTLPRSDFRSDLVVGRISDACREQGHLLSRMLGEDEILAFGNVRPISVNRQALDTQQLGFDLFVTTRYTTYRDDLFDSNPNQVLAQFLKEAKDMVRPIVREKQITNDPVSFAGFVAERVPDGEQIKLQPRVLALGTDWLIADDMIRQTRLAPEYLGRMALMVEIMRERPRGMGIESRALGTFSLPERTSEMGLLWLPVGLVVFGIIALGASVWVVRRT